MVGGVAHSGRVILAAGAVMVAVFFTFALSGPLPPREMGIILGSAVLLDAALIRLLLLPVLLRALGRWAWYLPRWAHRMLPAVRFGHAQLRRDTDRAGDIHGCAVNPHSGGSPR
jgi:RND superfamily putative drug exporter